MHPLYILQAIVMVVAVGILCYTLSKWRQPRLMFFACLAMAVSLVATGYLLEITATGLEGAIVANRLQNIATPFLGALFFLFSIEYCFFTVPSRWYGLLFIVPVVLVFGLLAWPMHTWYYRDFAWVAGGLPHLQTIPGPLYYINYLYNAAMAVCTFVVIARYSREAGANGRRHTMVVLGAIVIPLIAMVISFFGLPRNGWDCLSLALALDLSGLAFYIFRFRESEWQGLGRELVVENMKDAFILLDTRNRFLDANTTAYRFFPKLKHVMVGTKVTQHNCFPIQLLEDDTNFTVHVGGETLFLRSSRSSLKLENQVIGTGIMIYDDTENQRLMDELQQIATHDDLTGLYNRGTFYSYATRDFALCMRRREAGSILMVDIDHFKKVNDTYGHASGDKVLVAVAKILLERLRHTDICGRYGGEELIVWLPGAQSEGAAIIADVIRRAVEHTLFETDSGQFHVTVSIGVASISHGGGTMALDDLVNEADTALYQAKNAGRNRVCIYTAPTIIG